MEKKKKAKQPAKHPGGAPPMYKTVEQMQEKIDEYFIRCEGIPMLDENGKPIVTKMGIAYKVQPKPLTITGLALALGFSSRQALMNYQVKDQFNAAVMRAKARCEEYAEGRLFDKDGANGAKFSLANNFKDWKEKNESQITGDISIKVTLTDD
ncbi:MAG: terminase small subunit [Angelakisella sp.]